MGAVATDRVARLAQLTAQEGATLDELFQRMSDGEGLPAICRAWDVPYGRVLTWLMADAKRYEGYQRALEVAAHALVSETVAIADAVDPDEVPKARLQTDVRFRVAGAHAKRMYGEQMKEEKVLPAVQINIGVRSAAVPSAQVIEEGDV